MRKTRIDCITCFLLVRSIVKLRLIDTTYLLRTFFTRRETRLPDNRNYDSPTERTTFPVNILRDAKYDTPSDRGPLADHFADVCRDDDSVRGATTNGTSTWFYGSSTILRTCTGTVRRYRYRYVRSNLRRAWHRLTPTTKKARTGTGTVYCLVP